MVDVTETAVTDPKAARRAAQAEWARSKRARSKRAKAKKAKKTVKSARKAPKKRGSAATGARKASARGARAAKKPSKTGADRKTGEHIMSVHIPTSLLAKLDRKVAAKRASGERTSRSAYAVESLALRL